MHIAAYKLLIENTIPGIEKLRDTLAAKSKAFMHVVKIGRTHFMDATPLTLGQEFSGYVSQLNHGLKSIHNSLSHLSELALGGTAVECLRFHGPAGRNKLRHSTVQTPKQPKSSEPPPKAPTPPPKPPTPPPEPVQESELESFTLPTFDNWEDAMDALDAAVDASYYPGARRERAKKAFINAVKTHHITGKAATLAEKYASESKPTD
jgi:hypothetical protein